MFAKVQLMDPSTITLESTSKLFEYEKMSREIESCNDVEILKNLCRCYVKLYMKQQETLQCFPPPEFKNA